MGDNYLLDRKEALRYFGVKGENPEAEKAINLAYLKLRNEMRPRYVALPFRCHTENGDTVVLENGVRFHGKHLVRYLDGAEEVYLFGATLGSKVDMALRRMAVCSVAEAGAGQAVATALIETYCNQCCDELEAALPPGKKLKWRFSPGYGDWPLEEQRELFRALDCAKKIGLTLTASCMMAPVKSVTALIAVTDCGSREDRGDTCSRCGKADCQFRRKAADIL